MTQFCARRSYRQSQRGISLLLGLIILVALTLLALSAFNTTQTSLLVQGNEQFRKEATGAAQASIESLISTPAFIDTGSQPPVITSTVNRTDYTVNRTVSCIGVVDVPSGTLDPTDAADLVCIPSSTSRNSGVFGASATHTRTALCSDTRYAIEASVPSAHGDSLGTGTGVTIEQAVAVRMSKANSLTYCK